MECTQAQHTNWSQWSKAGWVRIMVKKTDCYFGMEIYDIYVWIDAEGSQTGVEFEV